MTTTSQTYIKESERTSLGKTNIIKTSTPVFIVEVDFNSHETKHLIVVDDAVYKNYISK